MITIVNVGRPRSINGHSKPERLCDAEKSVQRIPKGLVAPGKVRGASMDCSELTWPLRRLDLSGSIEDEIASERDLWQRQQRLVLRTHVLVGDVQENSRRRIVAHQRNDVDEPLVAKQFHGAGEGVGTHLVFPDRITTELHDDRILISQLRQRPAELDGVDDLLLQARLLR